jgi:hypothetical protein
MAGTGGASAPAPQRRLRCQGRARQRREQAASPSMWGPLGGSAVRQGAVPVRARCRANRGQERGLAAQPCAGAVQRRRCFSRCMDRSAGGADWHILSDLSCASLWWSGRRGGIASAVWTMAQPWTMVAWALGPRDRTTLPPQRRAGWFADAGAARCPWTTTQVRATATSHSVLLKAGSTGKGSPGALC